MSAPQSGHSRTLLIFDWDGTLVDSAPVIVAGMQAAIVELGLPPRSDRHIAEMIGLDMRDGLGRLYPELDTDRLLQDLTGHRQHSRRPEAAAPLFESAFETLQILHEAGWQLAVATGRQRRSLEAALTEYPELASLFEWTRCADDARPKPHPAMVLELLAVSGVPASQALVIGDTEYDVAMAAGAGVDALDVACGSHDAGRLHKAGALAVLPDVAALPRWLAG